jgi:predicted 3-demethylubiquinone-9 3-methyltransferase (glyoxalase superfamily)
LSGWLKDKYGLSWQIIPKALSELLAKDTSGRVMQAMLKMKKIIVKDLEDAYNQG